MCQITANWYLSWGAFSHRTLAMAMQVRRGHQYERDDHELQQAWHNLHTAAQRSEIMSACGDDGLTDGAQLDYVQYCQV